jgi:lysophospholipase L1-like esterase
MEGTVLFLGDSITHAGHYVADLEAVLQSRGNRAELINLGLPSETCTGLSEPDHPFPRPDVHDRIDNALRIVKPDLVFVCYGMNDGIYHPFSEERFQAYRAGIEAIIEKVHASGARLVLMTPPPFDPEPLRAKGKLKAAGAEKYAWFEIYENYDTEVMAPYSEWILQQGDQVEGVIDLRTPVLEAVAEKRKTEPGFTLSNDGVHINADGHTLVSRAILDYLGIGAAAIDELDPAVHDLTEKRQKILHDAWLSHVGHTRPQTKPGLPLETARIAASLVGSENPVSLFNGVDLKNWEGDESIWSVEDGVIVGRNEGAVPSSTYLFTRSSHRDFRLILDVKQTVSEKHSTMHSAVAALGERFTDKGDNQFGFKGPLLMFCHDWGIWDAYRRNRIEPAGQKGGLKIEAEKKGDWNRCEILVLGNRIRFVANGELVFDFTDDPAMLQKSPLGLQIHSNQKPQEYRFRGLVLCENPEDRLVTLKE